MNILSLLFLSFFFLFFLITFLLNLIFYHFYSFKPSLTLLLTDLSLFVAKGHAIQHGTLLQSFRPFGTSLVSFALWADLYKRLISVCGILIFQPSTVIFMCASNYNDLLVNLLTCSCFRLRLFYFYYVFV